MQVVTKQAEELLTKALSNTESDSQTWFAVHFICSKLQPENGDPKSLNIAINKINDILTDETGIIYSCNDKDIIILCAKTPINQLNKLVEDIKFLFVNDPFACSEESDFGKVYNLGDSHEQFYYMARQKQVANDELHEKKEQAEDENEPKVNAFLLDDSLKNRHKRHRLQILVVEDHDFSRKLVIDALGRDYDSIAAANGKQAIERYAANAPNIVFLDIGLPKIDGHNVLKRIMEMDKDAFVVMLSANTYANDVKGAITNGAKGFIAKPFTKEKIMNYIKKYKNNLKECS